MSPSTALQNTRIGSLRLAMLLIVLLASVVAFIRVGMVSDPFHGILPLFRYFPQGLLLVALMVFGFRWLAETRNWSLNFRYLGIYVGNGGPLILLTCALLASILIVFVAWSGAVPDYHYIGGMIPWSDASGYYYGAEHLLQTGLLDSWNQRRPLNAALFSVRLGLTGGQFQYALILQACLLAGAIFFASRAAAPRFGRAGAFMMFAILLGYSALYLPTTLSETLGITLGALAFALLWYGVERNVVSAYLVGLCALTLALLARPGAMLVLALLMVYAGYVFRNKPDRYSWRTLFIALTGIGMVGVFNAVLLAFYGDGSGMAQGNFSYVLYGLAAGGKGWTQIYTDFPQIGTLAEADAARFAYQKAIEQIAAEPLLIVKVYVYGLLNYPLSFLQQFISILGTGNEHLSLPKVVKLVAGVMLAIGLVRFAKRPECRSLGQFMMVCLVGIILSLPIVYSDGGMRIMASVIPFVAVIVLAAIVGIWKGAASRNGSADVPSLSLFSGMALPTFFLGMIMIAALIGPHVFRNSLDANRVQLGGGCMNGAKQVAMNIGPGMPYINLTADPVRSSFAPNIRIQDFVIPDGNEIATKWRAIPSPATIVSGYDMLSRSQKYLIAPVGFVGVKPEVRLVCVVNYDSYIWKVVAEEL